MVASFSIETEFEITYGVCGYHVYRHVWDAALREMLVCGRKPMNEKNRYVLILQYFNVPLIRCKKYFACLIFVVVSNHEIFLTMKISRFTVLLNQYSYPIGKLTAFPQQDVS